ELRAERCRGGQKGVAADPWNLIRVMPAQGMHAGRRAPGRTRRPFRFEVKVKMATQLSQARDGTITAEMIEVGSDEGLEPEEIRQRVACGTVVIPKNRHHSFRAIGVGKGLRTKINANIGASGFHQLLHEEVDKLEALVRYGADSCMDLS